MQAFRAKPAGVNTNITEIKNEIGGTGQGQGTVQGGNPEPNILFLSKPSFPLFPLRPQFARVQTGVKVGHAMAVQPVRSAKEIAPPIS